MRLELLRNQLLYRNYGTGTLQCGKKSETCLYVYQRKYSTRKGADVHKTGTQDLEQPELSRPQRRRKKTKIDKSGKRNKEILLVLEFVGKCESELEKQTPFMRRSAGEHECGRCWGEATIQEKMIRAGAPDSCGGRRKRAKRKTLPKSAE